ncbi:MAG: tetratricopeptide repeat protein [Deinococcus-Thermus bacterium]|jgi:Flp pilus assembly protein TadD|nr:tetratricopeptide repeat protein [Deinococcota bacterium]
MAVRALAVLALCVWVTACATGPEAPPDVAVQAPPVERDIESFAKAVESGRYASAVAGLRRVVQAHPDHTDAKILLARAYLGQGDVAPARQLFEEAARAATSPSQRSAALNGTGTVHLYDGELAAAERAFRGAVEVDERDAEAWNGLAQSLNRQGRGDAAERAIRRAVRLEPDWQAAHNNLGMILLDAGELAAAERAFADAHALAPDSAVVANNLRLAIALQGRYDEALAGVAEAGEPDAFNNIGYAALVRGDYAAADRYLRRAVETSPMYHREAHDNLRFLRGLRVDADAAS